MGDNEQAVLKTLIYSDLFDCPLTEKELYTYLESAQALSLTQVRTIVRRMQKYIAHRQSFFALKGREPLISLRQKREQISQTKISLARHVVRYLAWIPSLQFIGISGSVAVGNAEVNDDIDIFVISASNTLYTTRFFIALMLQLLGKRRHRTEVQVKNKLCVNLFIDEDAMRLPQSQHNLYFAREIAQVYPLFARGDTYARFKQSNSWVKQFLPNAFNLPRHPVIVSKHKLLTELLQRLEPCLRYLQLRYMHAHQTREIVTSSYLGLHPQNTDIRVLLEYQKKLNHYSISYKTKS